MMIVLSSWGSLARRFMDMWVGGTVGILPHLQTWCTPGTKNISNSENTLDPFGRHPDDEPKAFLLVGWCGEGSGAQTRIQPRTVKSVKMSTASHAYLTRSQSVRTATQYSGDRAQHSMASHRTAPHRIVRGRNSSARSQGSDDM